MVWPSKKNRNWKKDVTVKGSRKEMYGMIQNEMVNSCTEIHQLEEKELATD